MGQRIFFLVSILTVALGAGILLAQSDLICEKLKNEPVAEMAKKSPTTAELPVIPATDWLTSSNGYLYPPTWSVEQADAGGYSGISFYDYARETQETREDEPMLIFVSTTLQENLYDERSNLIPFEAFVKSKSQDAPTEKIRLAGVPALKLAQGGKLSYFLNGGEFALEITESGDNQNHALIDQIIALNIAREVTSFSDF